MSPGNRSRTQDLNQPKTAPVSYVTHTWNKCLHRDSAVAARRARLKGASHALPALRGAMPTVLARGDSTDTDCKLSAVAMLASLPNSAYSSLLSPGAHQVVDWSLHLQRLAR